MTRKDIAALEMLFVKRDKALAKLEALTKVKTDLVECGARMPGGGWENLYLPKSYIGAQWTVELTDLERRIRAAGGTIA